MTCTICKGSGYVPGAIGFSWSCECQKELAKITYADSAGRIEITSASQEMVTIDFTTEGPLDVDGNIISIGDTVQYVGVRGAMPHYILGVVDEIDYKLMHLWRLCSNGNRTHGPFDHYRIIR